MRLFRIWPVGATVAFGRRLVRQCLDDDVTGLSAELAYRFFLALFPFAIFVAGLGAFTARQLAIADPARRLADQLAGALPPEAATLVRQELERVIDHQDAGLISFGVLAAVFFATGGTNAVIKALNRAYDVDEGRPLVRRYALAIGLTLIAGTASIAAFVLYVSGGALVQGLAESLGVSVRSWDVLSVLRIPVTVVLLVAAVSILYRLGPDLRLRFTSVLPGAVLFAIGWLAATWAFGWFVTRIASYGSTYGALAGVAILLIWFYLSALVLLIGGEVNSVVATMRAPGRAQGADRADDDVTTDSADRAAADHRPVRRPRAIDVSGPARRS